MIVHLPVWLRELRRPTASRRRRLPLGFAAQSLESRTLLAGNVTAVVEDGNLLLTGDDENNSVEVTVVDGDIVVRGLEDTTVNGSATPFVAVAGMTTLDGDFDADLEGGDDTLRLTGPLTISGTTRIHDGSGATRLGITDVTFEGTVHIKTGHHDDAISFVGATLDGNLSMKVGAGDDLISLFETTVEGKFAVDADGPAPVFHGLRHRHFRRLERKLSDFFAEKSHFSSAIGWDFGPHFLRWSRGEYAGQNKIVIEDSTVGSFSFATGRGADDVVVKNSTIEGKVRGATGSGNDFVMFDGATVSGTTALSLERGKDKLVTENENTFEGDVYANGGSRWRDAAQISDETEFNGVSKFRRFESSRVSEATIESRGTETLISAAELREELNGLEDGGNDDDNDNDTDPPALTIDTSMNEDTVDSNGTVVTMREMFTIKGMTDPGATIDVKAGTSGSIDLGTTTADMDGNFSIDVMLLKGGTTIKVTSTTDGGSTTEEFNLHRAVGTVVRFTTSLGNVDVELLDEDAPNTVANFMSYFEDYTNSFIHRAGTGSGGVPSVVQGGGFVLDGTDIKPIDTNAPIENEFNSANSNVIGTLSMALTGDGLGGTNPDSGTSQWFFNLANNVFLDANKHTVFGRVIGDGLEVLQAIQALPTFDIAASVESDPVNGFDPTDALTHVPLEGYDDFSEPLPGTVSIEANSIVVTGAGTNFTQTLEPGELILIDGVTRAVLEVNSDTMLTLTSAPTTAVTDATIYVNPIPTADELVLFSSISVLLSPA